jgi:hypothetical protein
MFETSKMWKDIEEAGSGLFTVLSQILPGVTEELTEPSDRIDGLRAEIQTQ